MSINQQTCPDRRNSIMSVGLFTVGSASLPVHFLVPVRAAPAALDLAVLQVACGYIGARALPEILLDPAWNERLNSISVGAWRLCCSLRACYAFACRAARPASARPLPWCSALAAQAAAAPTLPLARHQRVSS